MELHDNFRGFVFLLFLLFRLLFIPLVQADSNGDVDTNRDHVNEAEDDDPRINAGCARFIIHLSAVIGVVVIIASTVSFCNYGHCRESPNDSYDLKAGENEEEHGPSAPRTSFMLATAEHISQENDLGNVEERQMPLQCNDAAHQKEYLQTECTPG